VVDTGVAVPLCVGFEEREEDLEVEVGRTEEEPLGTDTLVEEHFG